jgi:uncharacterized protein YecE (DUF72 family)
LHKPVLALQFRQEELTDVKHIRGWEEQVLDRAQGSSFNRDLLCHLESGCMNGKVYIGTSGFSYKSWDKEFYPRTVLKKRQLEFYATQFPTVEINATFYRLPTAKMIQGWHDRTDAGFVYAIKGSRFITHMKKLANLNGSLGLFFDRIAPLKTRIAVILWQLPPLLKKDLARLEAFLNLVPGEYAHAIEFRHESWIDFEVFELLRTYRAAHVQLSSGRMPMDLTVTSNVVYIRFHGLAGGPAHDYTEAELRPWAKHIVTQTKAGKTVYAYFNNDVNVRAPENARMLMRMTGKYAVRPDSA